MHIHTRTHTSGILQILGAFANHETNHNVFGGVSTILKGDGQAPSDSLARFFRALPGEIYGYFTAFCGRIFKKQFA